jgi:general secretion pathway protein D
VARLDRSDTSGTTVRVYRLKYGRAPQVAKIVNEVFVAQRSGPTTGDTPASQIAPGTSAAQSQLDSLKSASAGASTATARGAAPPRIAAAFENFDLKARDADATTTSSAISTDSNARGAFQNVAYHAR